MPRAWSAARRSRSAAQTWVFPSEAQCLACHTAAAGRTLGLEIGAAERSAALSADRPHRQPARDAECDRHAHAGGDARRRPRCRRCRIPSAAPGRSPSARAPTCTPTARSAIGRTAARPPTSTCATRRPCGHQRLRSRAAGGRPGHGERTDHRAGRGRPVGARRARESSRRAWRCRRSPAPQVDAAGVDLLTRWVNSLTGCN